MLKSFMDKYFFFVKIHIDFLGTSWLHCWLKFDSLLVTSWIWQLLKMLFLKRNINNTFCSNKTILFVHLSRFHLKNIILEN